jgi:hypothetical protein
MENQVIKLVAVIKGGFLNTLYCNVAVEYILVDFDLLDNTVNGPYQLKGRGEDLARFFESREVKEELKKAGY